MHKKTPYDVVIGILSGGVIPANVIANSLEVPLGVVGVKGFDKDNPESIYRNRYGKALPITLNKNTRILVVDDIIDHGNTLLATASFLSSKKVDACCLVSKLPEDAMYSKLSNIFENIFISEYTLADNYLFFPWEVITHA